MTVKSSVRFLIGILLAALILTIGVPYVGIPRAQLYPPPYIYASAAGKTQGTITKKYQRETSDPFHVGDKLNYVDYQFEAPYTPIFLGDQKSDPHKVYTGTAQIKNDDFAHYNEGDTVPIKYETTYPVISGIDSPYGGMNGARGSGLISGWIGWAIATVILGYFLSGALERVLLRESY